MKLRIKDSSIRLRLTQTEVASLAAGQDVHGLLKLGPTSRDCLAYGITISSTVDHISAHCFTGSLLVTLPLPLARKWHESPTVGLQATQSVDDGQEVTVLLEKDFTCLHRGPGENDSDTFPNPAKAGAI